MKALWQSLETWFKEHQPEVLPLLNPGATDAELDTLEKTLGVTLPPDVRASYKCHDGASEEIGLIDASEFLSVEEIERQWSVWKDLLDSGTFENTESDPETGIKPDWWNPAWIPITYNGAGDHICLDLDPAPGGQLGQMITMWHDDSERVIVAPSFRAWLVAYMEGLEHGQIVFSEDYGGFLGVEDL